MRVEGFGVQDFGFRVSGFGFRIQYSVFRAQPETTHHEAWPDLSRCHSKLKLMCGPGVPPSSKFCIHTTFKTRVWPLLVCQSPWNILKLLPLRSEPDAACAELVCSPQILALAFGQKSLKPVNSPPFRLAAGGSCCTFMYSSCSCIETCLGLRLWS